MKAEKTHAEDYEGPVYSPWDNVYYPNAGEAWTACDFNDHPGYVYAAETRNIGIPGMHAFLNDVSDRVVHPDAEGFTWAMNSEQWTEMQRHWDELSAIVDESETVERRPLFGLVVEFEGGAGCRP